MQAGGCHPFALLRACQAVDDAVGTRIVTPGSFVNSGVSRVVPLYEGESPYYVPFFIEAYVAVSVLDVLLYKFFIGIAAGPLLQVSAFAHDALSLFKELHKDAEFCNLCFPDFYHTP